MANKEAKLGAKFFGIAVFFAIVIFVSMVLATTQYVIYSSAAGHAENSTYENATEDVLKIYDININWSQAQSVPLTDNNISQVNISLPPNFTAKNILPGVDYTSAGAGYSFSITNFSTTYLNVSSVLSWSNFTGYLINTSANATFWFNATAATAGTFNIVVSMMNHSGTGGATPVWGTHYFNLTVTVKDTTAPVVNATSGATVPAGENFSMLKSGMNYSGNVTVRITATEDTPKTLKFIIINNSGGTANAGGEQVNLTGNQTITGAGADGYWYRRINTSTYGSKNKTDFTMNITVRLNDTAGLNGTTTFSNIRFEQVPPIIMDANISAPTAGGNYSGNVTFNITGYDVTGIIGFWNATNISDSHLSNGTFETDASEAKRALATYNTANLVDGVYTFYFIANDTAGNKNYTNETSAPKVTNVVIDNTAPTVTLTKNTASSTTSTLVVDVAVNDVWPGNVSGSCTHNQGDLGSISGSGRGTQTFTRTGVNCGQSVTIQITCTDYAGNLKTTSLTSTANSCPDGSSSGGGGGGSSSTTTWTNTYPADNKELSVLGEVSKSLGGKSRVRLKVSGETHYVGVSSVTSSGATIEVSSTPQTATLNIGETKKFDLASDGFYDLSVTLNSIKSGKADLTVKAISEKVPAAPATSPPAETTPEVQTAPIVGEGSSALGWIIAVVVIIALVVVGIIIAKKKRYF